MPCPLCGDICRCSNDVNSGALPRWLADDDARLPAEMPSEGPQAPETEAPCRPLASEDPTPAVRAESAPEDSPAWRDEVAARLNRYQAKRKPRLPRYPSLQLRFEEQDPTRAASYEPADAPAFPHSIGATSHQALALDSFAEISAPRVETPLSETRPQQNTSALRADESSRQRPTSPIVPSTAKIIEFPRSWTPPPAPLDQLAEPVINRPRILEAPEVVPPPPALGGITIEPAQHPEIEKRPGIDIPLQSAPLVRRVFSAAIDAIIVAAAGALFGFIFWKMTAIQPSRFQIAGLTAGLFALLWAAYQYLLVVYSGSTPGLRLAKLQLARFDASPASRRLRRWRVLASFLSAVSLGMGYAWVFLDEDALCWHDRITHTYLAPKRRE
jgi:uncharacterized RDD family membrane protein YckC